MTSFFTLSILAAICSIHIIYATPGHIVLIGGNEKTGGFLAAGQAFDTTTQVWSALPILPAPLRGPAVTSLNNFPFGVVYSIAGYKAEKQVITLDAPQGDWKSQPSLPIQKNDGASAFTIGSSIYVVGGIGDPNGLLTLPESSAYWVPLANSSHPHYYSLGTVFGGKFYICGDNWFSDPSKLCETYDPKTNVWTPFKSMMRARKGFSLVTLKNTMYAIGGYDGTNEIYDFSKKYWDFVPEMATPRYLHSAASDGRYVYAIGGQSLHGDAFYDSVEYYVPGEHVWRTSFPMVTAASEMGCTFVPTTSVAGPQAQMEDTEEKQKKA